MRPRQGESPGSLRATWAGVTIALLVIVLGLGSLAVAATVYQRTVFEDTTQSLSRDMSVLVGIDFGHLLVIEQAAGVVYQVDGPESAGEYLEAYDRVAADLDAAYAAATEVFVGTDAEGTVADAVERWEVADEAVRGAPALYESGEAPAELAAGRDPFAAPVWGSLGENSAELTKLRAELVESAVARSESLGRTQGLILPVVVAAVGLALLVSWGTHRRLNRRVFDPLVQLRDAAVAMGDQDLGRSLDLHEASEELRDLAETLNRTSTSLRATHDRLTDEARTDTLTGLANRASFRTLLAEALSRAKERRLAVLFVDLDDFKVVNDTQGHAAGDHVLQVVAARLAGAVRPADVLARLGGDEFAVLVHGADSGTAAREVAGRILEHLGRPVELDGRAVPVHCSVGVAFATPAEAQVGADELLNRADFAMYMAKSQGKNRAEVYSAAIHDEVVERTELRRALARAIAGDELELVFQPVVRIDSGWVEGFEALVRWRHPTKGLLSPTTFVPLAEESGDIAALGEWVLDRAVAELAVLQEMAERPMWVSVNASASQLTGAPFVESVAAATRRHGVRPDQLVLEVTESVALSNPEVGVAVLDQLRAAGVRVALDDFGTGYSSLRHLAELPVDIIKIDRSFVVAPGADGEALLEGIIRIGRRLGLAVVAEGIEEPSDLDRVVRLGVELGQGFLWSPPLDASGALRFLEDVGSGGDPSTAGTPLRRSGRSS